MNTKLLMTLSAVIMGAAGIVLTFAPDEIAEVLTDAAGTSHYGLTLQIVGALYFAFAMVNWTARANLIGGIYARPIAIGNLTHFVIAGLAVIKQYFSSSEAVLLPIAIVYLIFGISFTIVFFRHPVEDKEK